MPKVSKKQVSPYGGTRFLHLIDSGVSIGWREFNKTHILVSGAFCNDKDQFSRKTARMIVCTRMKSPNKNRAKVTLPPKWNDNARRGFDRFVKYAAVRVSECRGFDNKLWTADAGELPVDELIPVLKKAFAKFMKKPASFRNAFNPNELEYSEWADKAISGILVDAIDNFMTTELSK